MPSTKKRQWNGWRCTIPPGTNTEESDDEGATTTILRDYGAKPSEEKTIPNTYNNRNFPVTIGKNYSKDFFFFFFLPASVLGVGATEESVHKKLGTFEADARPSAESPRDWII